MTSYNPYGQGYQGSAGQTPGAPPGSYYAGQQYGGGGHPGQPAYGGTAPGAPYGPPMANNGYGQQTAGGPAPGGPGGPYGGHAPGGPYGGPGTNPYGAPQQGGQYGQRPPDMFDRSQSGRIDVFGFSALWTYLQQWKNMFQQFDRDRSGCINQGELHQALSQMGYNLSPQFIHLLMSRNTVRSANPGLQLDRFIHICTQLQSMTEAFRDKDTQRTGNVKLSYDDFLTIAVGRLL
ncbi:hypothetical protein GDO81_005879 [Engystomops pustulosus]|uniref:Peflin n=1 Tax=Engystomops pustulosus TaxID=76066 RepID=A0AAV7CVL3_ENGPU|nr:hypothetical protein GDO81_005879 [Engystomops pustulosus]